MQRHRKGTNSTWLANQLREDKNLNNQLNSIALCSTYIRNSKYICISHRWLWLLLLFDMWADYCSGFFLVDFLRVWHARLVGVGKKSQNGQILIQGCQGLFFFWGNQWVEQPCWWWAGTERKVGGATSLCFHSLFLPFPFISLSPPSIAAGGRQIRGGDRVSLVHDSFKTGETELAAWQMSEPVPSLAKALP